MLSAILGRRRAGGDASVVDRTCRQSSRRVVSTALTLVAAAVALSGCSAATQTTAAAAPTGAAAPTASTESLVLTQGRSPIALRTPENAQPPRTTDPGAGDMREPTATVCARWTLSDGTPEWEADITTASASVTLAFEGTPVVGMHRLDVLRAVDGIVTVYQHGHVLGLANGGPNGDPGWFSVAKGGRSGSVDVYVTAGDNPQSPGKDVAHLTGKWAC